MVHKCRTCERNKGGKRCLYSCVGKCTHYRPYKPTQESSPSWGSTNGIWTYNRNGKDNKK